MATSVDATSIRVRAPRDASQRVTYLSVLENLEVEPAAEVAKVIINSRTGTIIIGENVQGVTGCHYPWRVDSFDTGKPGSQPAQCAFAGGDTVVVPRSGIEVDENSGHMFSFQPGASLNEIVEAVNQVGAAPGDLMAILEAAETVGGAEG